MSRTISGQADSTSSVPADRTDAGPGGAAPTEEERAAAAAVLRMIWGMHVSRAIYAVTELGIPDRLADGPVSCAELARDAGAHEASLYRVLRLLAALGVVSEAPPGSFGLTILGGRLRSGAAASMRSWALLAGTVGGCQPFEHILHTVRTGQPGFDAAHGMPLFEFLAEHPADAAVFDAAMLERTAMFAPSVAAGYDFSDLRTAVDVGGGRGILLAAILRGHGHLQGTLFELPAVAAGAKAVLAAAGLTDRCEVVAGDFFRGVPAGADCYMLANVLHDWDDTRAVEILASCRKATTRHGRVLIIERLIPDNPAEALPVLLSDINMLVLAPGGRERTNSEYRRLLQAAGLRPGIIQPGRFNLPLRRDRGPAGLTASQARHRRAASELPRSGPMPTTQSRSQGNSAGRFPPASRAQVNSRCVDHPSRPKHTSPSKATGRASPDDPALTAYWNQRRGKNQPPLDRSTLRLLKMQHGRCAICADLLLDADREPHTPEEWQRCTAPPARRSPGNLSHAGRARRM